MSTREILALIPARGGSKSVPRKNLRPLAEKPLIVYSIEQALETRSITRVVVSTDDDEIAEVARRNGAEVPFMRPRDLAEDDTPDLAVFQHALGWLRHHEAYTPDVVVHLRPTAPIRRVETIERAIWTYLERQPADSLRSVSLAKQTPYKMWFIQGNGCMAPVIQLGEGVESYNMPRQALPRAYWQNGYIDITSPAVIQGIGSMTGTRILGFVIDEPCVEIDYEEHFELAERILTGLQPSPRVSSDPERFPS